MNSENSQQKLPRRRSRAYPVVALPDAIEKAEALRNKDGFEWTSATVATEYWGLKSASSYGMRMIAALLQYGLLTEEGSKTLRRVKLTDLARRILSHPDVSERKKAVQEAALKPIIYALLWEQHKPDLPSDEKLKWDLTVEGTLNEKVVDGFIKDYKATIVYAELEKRHILEEDDNEESTDNINEQAAIPSAPDSAPGETKPMVSNIVHQRSDFELPIYLSQGQATLRMPTPMSSQDFDKIKQVLESTLDALRGALVWDGPSLGDEEGE